MKLHRISFVLRAMVVLAIIGSGYSIAARPHAPKQKGDKPLVFLRQVNTKSSAEFYYTNRGVLFNSGAGNDEGLYWPRGSGDSYIFGEGLWFAAKKALPDSVQLEGWNFAGSVPGPLITGFVANSTTRRLFVADGTGYLYERQDTGSGVRRVIPFTNKFRDTAITALGEANGVLFVGTNVGLFEGPESGPWLPTSIVSHVSAIASSGVVFAGGTIYVRNSNGGWMAHSAPGPLSYLSTSAGGAVVLGGTPGGMLVLSKDTGKTWDTIFQVGISCGALAFDGTMIIGTEAGIEQSRDGSNWIGKNAGLNVPAIQFLRSDDGIQFILATASGVSTATFANGSLGAWKQISGGVPWQRSVVAVELDSAGLAHVVDSEGDIFTQWNSKTLVPEVSQKFCDMGYNANTGQGIYTEGETREYGLNPGTDGADPDAKYISYVGPRYDPRTGQFIPGSSMAVQPPYYNWPVWDTSSSTSFLRNYYFGDYISDVNMRNAAALTSAGSKPNPKPAMVSEEDIINLYSDIDTTSDSLPSPRGIPLGIDIQEAIYSWSFGRYRDIVFVQYKVKNASKEPLLDCWLAPAFDPDLDATVGSAANDGNSFVNGSLVHASADSASISELREPYRSDPAALNMAVQWRNYNQPPNGMQYGWLGISMVESPVVDEFGNVIPNDDSAALHGYGPNSLFQKNQEGLVTCKDWVIQNDPTTDNLRYDFVSSGVHDSFNGAYGDQRLLLATGPFNLFPSKSAEATIVLTFAHVSNTDYKQNFGALLLLTDFAHQVFGEVDSSTSGNTINYFVNNFQVTPPSSVRERGTPSVLSIEAPYPDPFSGNCTIRYSTAGGGEVTAVVSDELGRKVRTISLGEVPAGQHSFSIDAQGLAAGTYRVTITANGESRSESIVYKP